MRFRVAWGVRERPEPLRARAAAAGFTLVELMIALVIVGVLAVIAYPSYQDHLRKGRRSAAQSFMIEVAAREQQYLIDARSYAEGAGALAKLNLLVPAEVSRFYAVTIEPAAPAPPPSYTIVATPTPGSAQDPDGVLTLDHTGAKTRKGQAGW
jgi:type IV pilus assembly protein PilE